MPRDPTTLIVGCGALARELAALTAGLPGVEVALLPALLHNRPEGIAGAVRDRVRAARASGRWDRVLVAYADCGTGGALDRVCDEEGVERLPGAHCYEVYAGAAAFGRLQAAEPGTFYLTDFLVRAFDALVWRGLGLDRHPQLRDLYFAHYRRIVYLAQAPDERLVARARAAAERLGLAFELRQTGLAGLAGAIGVPARDRVDVREAHRGNERGRFVRPFAGQSARQAGNSVAGVPRGHAVDARARRPVGYVPHAHTGQHVAPGPGASVRGAHTRP